MKKTILLLFLVMFPIFIMAQGGWTKIIGSPVTVNNNAGIYRGAAWVDINNDGNTDLFTMPNHVFLNNGNSSFTELTGLNINPNPLQLPGGCSWGDIDNDGDIDFITAQNPSEIYLNNSDNTFTNISNTIPELAGYASWGAALGDLNNDSKLDLLYAQAFGFHGSATPLPCKLFKQDSNSFIFTPITGYTFTDETKPYTVPYFHDYDLDGDLDIFIASGPGGSAGPDFCYKNLKQETGTESLSIMTTEPWANQLQDGQCYNFIDYDNDGDLDLCLTNYSGASSRFYVNNGDTTYSPIITPFTNTTNRLSNDWGDYDNDGDLDVIIARDNATLNYYKNNGNGTFTIQTPTITVSNGSSCVINCDYDNDGDLDVFVNGNGTSTSLWKNDGLAGTRNWVNFNLKGTFSNTSAIGALVKIKSIINGNPVWQLRQVSAQNSFQGQNDLRIHFGLNDATVIDSLVIHWPSGLKEFYLNKPANVFETLIEGNGTPLNKEDLKSIKLIKILPNPAHEFVKIWIEDTTSKQFDVKVADTNGKIVYENMFKENEFQLQINKWPSGCYIFLITYDNKIFSNKIIVQ